MSTNLATILVGLGYDLSALEKGAPEAFRLINSQTAGMSAEMKRTSREGAESLRLIDEALGIHLSRPLTRILTQEFPGLAKGLQSILGAGVVGALGLAAFEFFDRIAKGIEKAQKAQEEFAAAQEKLVNVQTSIGDQWQEKINKISFSPEQKIFAEGATEALKQIKELGSAIDELQKKEQAALHPAFFSFQPGPETLAGIKAIEEFFSSDASKRIENNAQHFEDLRKSIEAAFQADKIMGTDNAIKAVEADIASLNALLAQTQGHGKPINIPGLGELAPPPPISPEGLKAAQDELQYLTGIKNEIESQRKSWQALTAAQEAQAAALQRQAEAAKAFADLQGTIGASLAKLQPQTDPIAKLSEEIRLLKYKAEQDFAELGRTSTSALQMRAAMSALDQYEHRLDGILAKAKNEADIAKAQAELPTKIAATTAAPQLGTAGVTSVLGVGGSVAEQFDAFLKDIPAQLKLQAEAYQELITPADKFRLIQQELNVIFKNADGSFKDATTGAAAYAAAIQKAREEMAKATDQMERLLKTGGASGGLQAFLLQLKGQGGKGSDAQFTFELLNKGLQGFEDETVKALTGAKTSWKGFFESLDQMALKFVMNKLFSQLLSASGIGSLLNGLFSGGGGAASGGGANIGAELTALDVGGFAEGTDFAPGGMSWVGENGPELMNVPAGASITPTSAMTRGVTVPIQIDARGAELGVEEKIARAMAASAPHLILRAVAEMNEVQRRTPR